MQCILPPVEPLVRSLAVSSVYAEQSVFRQSVFRKCYTSLSHILHLQAWEKWQVNMALCCGLCIVEPPQHYAWAVMSLWLWITLIAMLRTVQYEYEKLKQQRFFAAGCLRRMQMFKVSQVSSRLAAV